MQTCMLTDVWREGYAFTLNSSEDTSYTGSWWGACQYPGPECMHGLRVYAYTSCAGLPPFCVCSGDSGQRSGQAPARGPMHQQLRCQRMTQAPLRCQCQRSTCWRRRSPHRRMQCVMRVRR
jgi:hypothetical protein